MIAKNRSRTELFRFLKILGIKSAADAHFMMSILRASEMMLDNFGKPDQLMMDPKLYNKLVLSFTKINDNLFILFFIL